MSGKVEENVLILFTAATSSEDIGKNTKADCVPAFGGEGKRGPFVREVEKCAKKRFGTAL